MKTILASRGFCIQRQGPVMFINDRKFALFVSIHKMPTLLLVHGPANRFGSRGIGVWLPVPLFQWWRDQCVAGNLITIAAQCKKTDSRYTLIYAKMKGQKIPVILRTHLPYVYLSLTMFQHTKVPYVKPPRHKNTSKRVG
jgi:hypothetical protein